MIARLMETALTDERIAAEERRRATQVLQAFLQRNTQKSAVLTDA
jgi:hypothetical protein